MSVSKKSVAKPKFTRAKKEKPELKVVEDDLNFDELVDAAKGLVADAFIPTEGQSLVEVSDWITMPDPIQEIMGTPGLPCGHIVEAYGKPDSGKTTFCTHALIGTQQDGGIAILIDTEHKYDLERACAMGLDRKGFIITRAETIEEVFEKYVGWMNVIKSKEKWRKRKVCLVWDSLGSTPCANELDSSKGDHNMLAAGAITGGLRRTRYFLRQCNAAFLIINQVTTKQTKTPWEKKTTAKGGLAPKYFSSVRLEFTPVGKLTVERKGVKTKVGIKTQIEVVKNHLAPPFKRTIVQIDKKGIIYGGRKIEST